MFDGELQRAAHRVRDGAGADGGARAGVEMPAVLLHLPVGVGDLSESRCVELADPGSRLVAILFRVDVVAQARCFLVADHTHADHPVVRADCENQPDLAAVAVRRHGLEYQSRRSIGLARAQQAHGVVPCIEAEFGAGRHHDEIVQKGIVVMVGGQDFVHQFHLLRFDAGVDGRFCRPVGRRHERGEHHGEHRQDEGSAQGDAEGRRFAHEPSPRPLPHGWLSTASRLSRHRAVLCETPASPRGRG